MYLTVNQQIKHLSKDEYYSLKKLSHIAKNLFNEATYNIRQHYFNNNSFLKYEDNYKLLKSSVNYKLLNSNMSQQILKEVDGAFKSFFGLLKLKKLGNYNEIVKIPKYLPKDGYTTLVIGFVRINNNKLVIPYSNTYKKKHANIEINIPPILANKDIKEIRIIPLLNAKVFEIQYTYYQEEIDHNLNEDNVLSLDLGVNNLITAVTNKGKSFIIDGRRLKSINQWFNKHNAKLQSIKDKQKIEKNTYKQKALYRKRNNQVNDYMNKAVKMVISYCIKQDIGKLIVGYNKDFQRGSNIGKVNNQAFVNIPFAKLINKLDYKCRLNGISLIKQEESYTSKASFFDNDEIPEYDKDNNKEYAFHGKRIKRGLYKTSKNLLLNADINAALNILNKSKVVSLDGLYSRGDVDTPIRIRIV